MKKSILGMLFLTLYFVVFFLSCSRISKTQECLKCDEYINLFNTKVIPEFCIDISDTIINNNKYSKFILNDMQKGFIENRNDTIWFFNENLYDKQILFSYNFKLKSKWKIKHFPYLQNVTASLDSIYNDLYYVSFIENIPISHPFYIKKIIFNKNKIFSFELSFENTSGKRVQCRSTPRTSPYDK